MRRVRSSALQSGFRLSRIVGLCALAFAAIPAQGALALPSGMHYEMVSPADVGGTRVIPTGSGPQSSDGSRVRLDTGWAQGFGDGSGSGPPSMVGAQNNLYVATRTSSGWRSLPTLLPAVPDLFDNNAVDVSDDLTTTLLWSRSLEQFFGGQEQLALTGLDGSKRKLLPVLSDLSGVVDAAILSAGTVAKYRGASGDFSHVFVSTTGTQRLLPTDAGNAMEAFKERIYELVPDAGVVRRVDVDEAGAVIGQGCGAKLGSPPNSSTAGPNAISRDGSRVFFIAQPGQDASCSPAAPGKLFARVDGAHTVELSASECQRSAPLCLNLNATPVYQGASLDGGRVVFTSTNQLADSDTDFTADLYLYDFDQPAGQHLTQLSAGDASDATPGAGATVQGVVQVSADGARIYFVARDVLTTAANALGQSAASGVNNLYVVEPATGVTRFVAGLDAGDSSLWTAASRQAQLADDAGRRLVFAPLTAIAGTGDADAVRDVFRYDAQIATLVKVSPGNDAAGASIEEADRGSAALAQRGRVASVDGSRVLFSTVAALQGEDTNAKSDVYLWTEETGGITRVELVGDGQDPFAVASASLSSDGSQVVFATTRRLVPEDVDDVGGAYAAREGPDVERPPAIDGGCVGDACQGTPAGPPAAAGVGSSASRAGNVDGDTRPAIGAIRKLTVRDRSALVRGGKARLRLRVNRPGRVTVAGTAKVGRKKRRVVSSSANAKKAGTVAVPFALSKSARSALRSRRTLTVALTVRFKDARPKVVSVTLRSAVRKKGGRS